MKKAILLGCLSLVCLINFAQKEEEAKALLDEVYQKAEGYKNIVIDFKYTLKNTEEDVDQEVRGDVTVEGEKYLLHLLGATRIHDGKKLYTIVPENEEVTIRDSSEQDEEEQMVTPQRMLSFSKDGYTYQWDVLQTQGGYKIQYIRLTPIDSASEIKYILLGIDNTTKHIYKVIQVDNNNTSTTITVNSFKTDQPLSPSLFTFNRVKYEEEGYYIDY